MKRRQVGWFWSIASVLMAIGAASATFLNARTTLSKPFDPVASVEYPSRWSASNADFAKKVGDSSEIFELTGAGDASEWRSSPIRFENRKLYRFRFKASTVGDGIGDCAPCGTTFAHYDFKGFPKNDVPEKSFSFVFFVPDDVSTAALRLAQWETRRVYRFAEPTLSAVQPVFKLIRTPQKQGTLFGELLPLGDGESISDGVYRFSAFRSNEATNFDRPLHWTTSQFNTSRWTFGNESCAVYRLALESEKISTEICADGLDFFTNTGKIVNKRKLPFVSGSVSVDVGYWRGGRVVVEASFDDKNWTKLTEIVGLGAKTIELNDFLDGKQVDEVFIRLRGEKGADGSLCSAQIYGFSAEMKINDADAALFEGIGKTIFADLDDENAENLEENVELKREDWTLWGFAGGSFYSRLGNRFVETNLKSPLISVAEKSSADSPDEERYVANFKRPASFAIRVFPYFRQDYTRKIAGVDGETSNVSLSWCEPDRRVPRNPERLEILPAEPLQAFAAKNDVESFQLVLRSSDGLRGLSGEILDDLRGENGESISAENVDLRYAYYHYVSQPTDKSCAVGFYPDALVPLEKGADGLGQPLNVEPDCNQPIWITVSIPANASAGTYRGAVRLTTTDGRLNAKIPFELTVWNFALPAKNTLETAYGVSPSTIWRYHNCKTEEDKRAVFEKYLKIFGDYRVSPYNPAPLDGIDVHWFPDSSPPRCELDFSRFETEMKRVFDQYNFTNFLLPFVGLGGGTYESRSTGSIAGFGEDTSEYKALLADYGAQLQARLRDAELLDAAYVYWFDEPQPKDYAFVADGFAKLTKYAPDLTRMLTEEPSTEFQKILEEKGADVDVWCPISNAYSDESAQPQRDLGNRFWWYVCTVPKSPYCTEFLDHPALELRIWHWQTFERKIVGCLVWESTYWTSSAAFPNGEAQNPYLDPASYVSGYSTSSSSKINWGNGDGRFIYPPLSAATPGRNNGEPIFDEPVASIRWEEIREGIQDYEMLTMLANLVKNRGLTSEQQEKIEEIFNFLPITSDMTTFSLDPARIYEKRRAVAEAILELNR